MIQMSKFKKSADLDNVKMVDFYRQMLYIRMVSVALRQSALKMELKCPVHFSFGQEATAVGVGMNLKKKDAIVITHRSHAPYLAKGGDLKKMIAEIYNKKDGTSGGIGGSMHLNSPEKNIFCSAIVSGGISIAAGLALSFRMKRKNNVAVAFFGDGAVEEGGLSETLNFAALKKLPMVFFCENNMYAVNSHISETKAVHEVSRIARAYDLPAIRIDGNNILEVYKAVKTAVNRARNSRGSTFIEATTYRWLEHVGPRFDHISGLRPEKEVRKWISRCPLKSYEKYLLKKTIINNKEISKFKVNIERRIKAAWEYMDRSPYPKLKQLEKII
ncbi:MAG: dehydrogenase [Elusimicrobia bacterium HGW-Elusimicrobia-2]|nr:MAG: dehydrogenase [Elusimicrobia bacterium HGW-Elusimicrobia-2]